MNFKELKKEIHLLKLNRESHLFNLIEEGRLQSYCGLHSVPNYSPKNLKNIFYNPIELNDYILNKRPTNFCDICRIKFNRLT